jgi:hypothetical protein
LEATLTSVSLIGANLIEANLVGADLIHASESTGTTKETVARRLLRSREGDIQHEIPVNPKIDRVTFEDAAKDLLNDYEANKRRSLDSVKRRVRLHLGPFCSSRRPPQCVTPPRRPQHWWTPSPRPRPATTTHGRRSPPLSPKRKA